MKTQEKKPKAKLIGANGNIYDLIGIASTALKEANKHAEADEMTDKIFKSGSYDEALNIIREYCDVV
jgi:hypothetical protein